MNLQQIIQWINTNGKEMRIEQWIVLKRTLISTVLTIGLIYILLTNQKECGNKYIELIHSLKQIHSPLTIDEIDHEVHNVFKSSLNVQESEMKLILERFEKILKTF